MKHIHSKIHSKIHRKIHSKIHKKIHRKKGGTLPYATKYSTVLHKGVLMSIKERTIRLQDVHNILPTEEERR